MSVSALGGPVILAGLLQLLPNGALAQQTAIARATADVSGRWSGTIAFIANSGSPESEPLYLKLIQTLDRVSGSGGSSFEANSPIIEGVVLGDRVRMSLRRGSVVLKFELQHQGSELTGTVRSSADTTRSAGFKAQRTADLLLEDYHPPLSFEGGIRSQAILELREDLRTGRGDAVAEFWQRLSRTGAPIVERPPDSDDSYFVTFVWRGSNATRHVLLERGRFTEAWPARHMLSHIPDTDVWFKTLRLPRGSRLRYGFSENDGRALLPPQGAPRSVQHDPLNTQRITNQSVLELPGAAPQPWYTKRPDVPTLTLTRERLKSELLGTEREILIYTPPGYSRTRAEPYPTVYLFDGNDPDGDVFASQTVENLIHERRIPPVVVVRIGNVAGMRSDHLSCNEKFSRFLADELAPFVRRSYHVSTSASKTLMGGKSVGGLAAACAGLYQPGAFGLLLVQSGSFWWQPLQERWAEPNWVARQFATKPKLPLTFYLEAGIWEVDLDGTGGNILETSRHLRDVLIAKGYSVTYREFAGDHDRINWRGTFADGLIALLEPLVRQ
jgi:enterochelin esterase family protein